MPGVWIEIFAGVKEAVFYLGGDEAPGPDGFPFPFFQQFWSTLKVYVMVLMKEFHERGKLSKMWVLPSFILVLRRKVLIQRKT